MNSQYYQLDLTKKKKKSKYVKALKASLIETIYLPKGASVTSENSYELLQSSMLYIQNSKTLLLLSYLVIFSQVQLQQEQTAMFIQLRGLCKVSLR